MRGEDGGTPAKLTRVLYYAIAIIVGTLPGFFIVLNSIFSDIFTLADRLSTFVAVIIVYTVFGAIFGVVSPGFSWRWGIWLSIPAIVFIAFFTIAEPRILLHSFYIVLMLASACFGAYAGSRVRLLIGVKSR